MPRWCVAPLVFWAVEDLVVVPGCLVCSRAAARPRRCSWCRAAWCARGWRPARESSAPRASLGASTRCPARPCRRPPAPRPRLRSSDALHAGGAWFAGKCPSFRNFACNSPPVSCWFVSVCNVTSLVFLNCMRLLLGQLLRRSPLNNFACNSLLNISNFEFISLGLQRFWTLLKVQAIELHAKFGERHVVGVRWSVGA